ncbi:MAG: flavodoxin domain-containing protein [Burkholderiaceae bacterium]
MLVLVIYGTVEGHTGKIAGKVASQIEAAGHQVNLTDVRQPGFAVPGQFDAAIVCAPIHLGEYPAPVVQFLHDYAAALNQIPSALITVSLSIASLFEAEVKQANAYPEHLVSKTGWLPTMRHNAAGALKYLEYSYFKRLLMRHIAAKEGGPVNTTADHELTDWDSLQAFVGAFADRYLR